MSFVRVTDWIRFHASASDSVVVVAHEIESAYAISRYRCAKKPQISNEIPGIIKRTGVGSWPKLFQNFRSGRETEMAETSPRCTLFANGSAAVNLSQPSTVCEPRFLTDVYSRGCPVPNPCTASSSTFVRQVRQTCEAKQCL